MADLILLRHGQSQWNLDNRFTGWVDVPLSARGEAEARAAGEKLRGRRLDKAEAAKKFGAEQIHRWRRSFDERPPGGESLADTAARVLPYWEAHLLPDLRAGKNLLLAAHGNSLRALVMHLDGLSKE